MGSSSSRLFRALCLAATVLAANLTGPVCEAELPDVSPGSKKSPPMRFQHLTQADGLSHSRVLDVVQDPDGFIWLATQSSLDRYDGHRTNNGVSILEPSRQAFAVYQSHDFVWDVHTGRDGACGSRRKSAWIGSIPPTWAGKTRLSNTIGTTPRIREA